jgi:predicted nucleotidyltransferase
VQPFPVTLSEAALAAVVRCLAQDDKIAAAYLLGSGAEERLRADSDVDIALLPVQGKHFTALERLNLAADLTSLAGRPVDLGILQTGNLVYAKEAVTRGRVIFERDHAVTTRFAALVLSMYADLQENRREVLNAYAA